MLRKIFGGLSVLLTASSAAFAGGMNVNVGRYDSVHVVPAPGAVKIDGDLKDWDKSGGFFTYRFEEEKDRRNYSGYMMYDAQNLYIGAHVADSTPLRNLNSPEADARVAWRGDCLQVRVSTDPKLGWPLKGYTGDTDAAAASNNIAHLTMWYYTPKQQACLQIQYGMDYHGLTIMPAGFQGAYKADADGKGYTLEYALSWKLLNAAQSPPKGGDTLACTWQNLWSDPQGHDEVADLSEVRNPDSAGFVYQSADAWGKALYESKGHLAPGTVKVLSGGKTTEAAPGFIPIKYTIPGTGSAKVSMQIRSTDGRTIRWLLGEAQRNAGENTEVWNGLDNDGKPVAAGNYVVDWCYQRGVQAKWLAAADNPGTPSNNTSDNTGSWAGDYGTPVAVAANATHVFIAHENGEASRVLIKVTPQGRRVWGVDTSQDLDGNVLAMTTDDAYLYVLQGHSLGGKQKAGFIKISCDTGFNEAIGTTGRAYVVLSQPDANGGMGTTHDLSGIAVNADTVFASSQDANQIFCIEKNTGKQSRIISIEKPAGLAVGPDDSLYAISGSEVIRMKADGSVRVVLVRDLPDAKQLAVAKNGEIFVTLQGDRQQVLRFDQNGKLLRAIGANGGMKVPGPWVQTAMRQPLGVAVAPDGNVWVAEATNDPKRSSVWTPDGKFVKEFIGPMPYSSGAVLDPLDPTTLYASNVRFHIDYKAGKSTPVAVIYHAKPFAEVTPTQDQLPEAIRKDQPFWPYFTGMGDNHFVAHVLRRDGRTFLFETTNMHSGLSEIKNDKLIPLVAQGYIIDRGAVLGTDRNRDGRIDLDEMVDLPAYPSYWGMWMTDNLDLYGCDSKNVWRIPMTGFDAQGFPQYDMKGLHTIISTDPAFVAQHPETALVPFNVPIEHMEADDDGNVYVLFDNGADKVKRDEGFLDKGHRLAKFSPQGKLLWEYRNVVVSHPAARNTVISKPGEIIGAIKMTGDLGRYITLASYYGQYHVLDKDTGLYIASLTPDTRSDPPLDEMTVLTENFNGNAVFDPDTNQSFYVGGDTDARVWQVQGLDGVKFGTLPLRVSTQDQARAAGTLEGANTAGGRNRSLVALANANVKIDGDLADWQDAEWVYFGVDENRKTRAAASWTKDALLLAFDVNDDSPMLNRGGGNVFKTGDSVEFDVSSAAADAARADEKPITGDKRILITFVGNKPVAMLYEPKSAREEKTPGTFHSPTGNADYDVVAPLQKVQIAIKKRAGGYTIEAKLDAAELGFANLAAGQTLRGDFGTLFSDKGGTITLTRAMWADNSDEVAVNNDVPTEARLHPGLWGSITLR